VRSADYPRITRAIRMQAFHSFGKCAPQPLQFGSIQAFGFLLGIVTFSRIVRSLVNAPAAKKLAVVADHPLRGGT